MGSFRVPGGAAGAMQLRAYGGGRGATTPSVSRGGGGGTPAPTPSGGAGGATAVTGGSDIMSLYAQALERLSTGGLSLEASLADIEEGKKQAIARGQQSMVSGGLGGTTVMGGVPVAAEKTAGRARLAARGEAEGKYLTTLASYAAFAQNAQQATADRQAAMQRLQLQIGSQERMATQSMQPVPSQSEVGGPSYIASTQPSQVTPQSNYSQQFPSIYGEAEEQVPNWSGDVGMSGAGGYESLAPAKTGIAGMSTEELNAFKSYYS